MPRYKLVLEYDGRPFVGWQRQANGLAVQQVVEEGFYQFCGIMPTIHAAGRTDAGVHAKGQVIHVDLEKSFETHRIREALNYHMRPHPVVCLSAEEVGPDFHARFSALSRAYLYRILNRAAPPAIEKGLVWHVPQALDVDKMHQAAQAFVGTHDFTSFRASQCQASSPLKSLEIFTVKNAEHEVHFYVKARSFLHHQVRNMVGTLVLVGKGKWMIDDVGFALAAKSRAAAGPTAPAEGLYFLEARYA
ncbi:MAG: tRNA pseudouridine(38-40) synthase TruA [Holosporales bacterium]